MAKKATRKETVIKEYGNTNIDWIDIGVRGLEDFVPGLPRGDAILVRGEPGTGKSICCLQFCHQGIMEDENVIYITTEEMPYSIIRTGTELWSDFPDLIEKGKFNIVNLSIDATYKSDYSLVSKAEAIEMVEQGMSKVEKPQRIVIDSLSALKRRLADENEFREVFMKLLLMCKSTGATTLMSAEGIPMSPDITEYLVDHLIYLDYHKHDVVWTRVFILRKSRSVALKPQILKLNIAREGLFVEEIPISLKPVWFQSKM